MAEEGEDAKVAENLELLADFGADVSIGGVEMGEVGFEGVGVSEGEVQWRVASERYGEMPASGGD